MSSLAEKML